jgi:zinc D-Ala-D-Ala carboxypeptidase
MKSTSSYSSRPKSNGIDKHVRFIVLMLFSAGLVLIMGAKAEQFFALSSARSAQSNIPVSKSEKVPSGIKAVSQSAPSIKPSIAPTPLVEVPIPAPASPPPIDQIATDQIPTIASASVSKPQQIARSNAQAVYGHFPYAENLPERLVGAGRFVRDSYEREELLDAEAAQAFEAMKKNARTQGIQLMAISGFRNTADQRVLFENQIARRGSPEAAARLSAPPGHSEHHTGYALDITDASRSDVDLKVAFEETSAYQWLITNAQQYGFEQSFPRNNVQGVSYEPWHWRFVGSARSAQVFSVARGAAQ